MTTFYDNWIGMWDQAEEERSRSRLSIHEEELEWVETVQDHRAALMISPETGFRTWGTTTMTAEIPPGGHTGAHKHGEEAMFIVAGAGYSVVDNIRYNWHRHSVIAIPFGSVHQHFNTSSETVRYVSILSVHLEHFCGLHRTVQVEHFGMTTRAPDVETSPDGFTPDGARRIVMHREDAPPIKGGEDADPQAALAALGEFDAEHPLVRGDDGHMPKGVHTGGSESVGYMSCRVDGAGKNGFYVNENEISGIISAAANSYNGLHAHMEAHLYCISGHGYSTIGDERVDWKEGTAFWVPGPQTPHRHFNESDQDNEMLRCAFGIRYFFQRAASQEFPRLYFEPRQGVLTAGKPRSEG